MLLFFEIWLQFLNKHFNGPSSRILVVKITVKGHKFRNFFVNLLSLLLDFLSQLFKRAG